MKARIPANRRTKKLKVPDMTHDSMFPPVHPLRQPGNAAYFLRRLQIPHLAAALDLLAKAERKLGLDITEEQIHELEAHKDDINYEVARSGKRGPPRRDEPCVRLRPAVPQGGGHHPSGCHFSCYVGDNTDVVILREASRLVRKNVPRW